ncbi:MAG: DUF971 domain-containing protein [Gammaproteobacteria bacterium]|nr:DUF971 domain-containing protein [Gammaproteobacteria bacterium]
MPQPVEIKLHQKSALLEISFGDGINASLSAEYLRVYSPSAEVKGHTPDQAVLQVGKENISINGIEPVGNYAIKLVFSDGHDTGLYTWKYLYELAVEQESKWQDYLERLEEAGYKK